MSQITTTDATPFQNSTKAPSNPIVRREAVHPKIVYEQENKKGILIIFNHYEVFPYKFSLLKLGRKLRRRDGSEEDVKNLKKCFGNLNFKIEEHHEKTDNQIRRVLEEVAQADHTNTSCIVVVLMTHGEKDGFVLAANKKYCVSRLWQTFEEAQNSTLHDIPKLFFIEACRGKKIDEGVIVTDGTNNQETLKVPTRADYLIMYSTVEDTVAFIDDGGSWFISTLCEELSGHMGRDLLEILTAVNRRIAIDKYSYNPRDARFHDKKQVPQIVSMLTRHLFFY